MKRQRSIARNMGRNETQMIKGHMKEGEIEIPRKD